MMLIVVWYNHRIGRGNFLKLYHVLKSSKRREEYKEKDKEPEAYKETDTEIEKGKFIFDLFCWGMLRYIVFDCPRPPEKLEFELRYKLVLECVEVHSPFIVHAPRLTCLDAVCILF